MESATGSPMLRAAIAGAARRNRAERGGDSTPTGAKTEGLVMSPGTLELLGDVEALTKAIQSTPTKGREAVEEAARTPEHLRSPAQKDLLQRLITGFSGMFVSRTGIAQEARDAIERLLRQLDDMSESISETLRTHQEESANLNRRIEAISERLVATEESSAATEARLENTTRINELLKEKLRALSISTRDLNEGLAQKRDKISRLESNIEQQQKALGFAIQIQQCADKLKSEEILAAKRAIDEVITDEEVKVWLTDCADKGLQFIESSLGYQEQYRAGQAKLADLADESARTAAAISAAREHLGTLEGEMAAIASVEQAEGMLRTLGEATESHPIISRNRELGDLYGEMVRTTRERAVELAERARLEAEEKAAAEESKGEEAPTKQDLLALVQDLESKPAADTLRQRIIELKKSGQLSEEDFRAFKSAIQRKSREFA